MTDSPRARTLINLSAVLYEQSAARPGLPAEVSNIDLDFVLGVAFIPDVYMADSLRIRTLINLSAVLYEQAAARTGLSAEVGNIDLNFVPSVAFIPDVYMADSLRARTLINLSAVLYEQAAARTSLSAEVGIIDLNFVPGVAFDAMRNVELTGDLLGDADRVNNNNNNVTPTLQFSPTALLNLRSLASKRPALSGSDLDRRRRIKVSFCRARNNRNNLNIIVTDPTGREFSRVDMKSSTRLSGEGPLGSPFSGLISMTLQLYCKQKWAYDIGKFYKGKNIYIYVLRSVDKIRADVADVFDTVISKSDKVPTRELSSYIKTELYLHQKQALYFMWDKEQDYSAEEHDYCKFYCLVITSEDTHCKQTIKKAYIMSLERASLILFMT
ncbi:hypothetical protein HBI88_152590 [Parastagonospora nodorum]|nr:hypothetical protein HBI97_038650 [Parastagonospora nodorum]KAH5832530.1 hypothetical protein HBI96_015380 [Parastagonospora nodorum]KAH5835061.1 hypothetical protein HBI94_015810 [Parastagonospora nodorum]KAH5840630.1 hypothetical protein HBI93_036590 [Parastagonospora nodorum]KAH5852457.1 hypothetical protein HBI90_203630 [Parastagonospora nodorum]